MKFKNVLLFSGTEDNGSFALKRAVQLAQENGARLTILDVLKPAPVYAALAAAFDGGHRIFEVELQQSRVEQLREVCAAEIPDGVEYEIHVVMGVPTAEIVRFVVQKEIDLVLKTADGRGILERTFFGSVAMDLLRNCPCPVWILRPDNTPAFDRIVAAVDVDATGAGHDLNHSILDTAATLAQLDDAQLHVVHAWDLWMEKLLRNRSRVQEDDLLDMLQQKRNAARDSLERLLQEHDLTGRVESHLLKGAPGYRVPEYVDHVRADLLVMGTVCRTGVEGFLIGNTAESILNDVDASVLALKPEGFVSPLKPTQSSEPREACAV